MKFNLSEAEHGSKVVAGWDKLVDQSNNGTLFHKLDFLFYHGKRFSEVEKCLVWRVGEQPFGLMASALSFQNGKNTLISPYGASFGGSIFQRPLKLQEALNVADALKNFLSDSDIDVCRLTLAPRIYWNVYCEAINFCLEKIGFSIDSRDNLYAFP